MPIAEIVVSRNWAHKSAVRHVFQDNAVPGVELLLVLPVSHRNKGFRLVGRKGVRPAMTGDLFALLLSKFFFFHSYSGVLSRDGSPSFELCHVRLLSSAAPPIGGLGVSPLTQSKLFITPSIYIVIAD